MNNMSRLKILGISFLGYSSVSLTYFNSPSGDYQNHRQEINQGAMLINCAHRCGCYEGFENTVPAALKAITVGGSQMLEFDMHQTKDKVPILQHDLSLKRTCNHGRFTHDFLYKDLPPLHSEIDVPYVIDENGKWVMYQRKNNDAKKPNSLEELLIALNKVDKDKKIWLNFEFKQYDRQFAQTVHQLLIKYGRNKKSLWFTSDSEASKELSHLGPEIKRIATPKEVMTLYLLYYTGLLPFVSLGFQSLQMPYLSESYKKSKEDQFTTRDSWRYRMNIRVLNFMLKTSKPLFFHLQQRGIHIMMWVPNTEQEYEECMQTFGPYIDGIITDRPSLLRSYLEKNKIK